MRRTVGLAAVVMVLMALVGVANATPISGSVPTPLSAVLAGGPSGFPTDGSTDEVSRDPAASPPRHGPELVGAFEEVDAVLGGAEAAPSATFTYPGAEYVKVHLAPSQLHPDDYLTVSDPRGDEVHRYDGNDWPEADRDGRWTMSVTGDTAVVTLHSGAADGAADGDGAADSDGAADGDGAAESAVPGGEPVSSVRVDRVARGFQPGQEPVPPPGPSGREESVCGGDDSRDAACYRSSHPRIFHNAQAVVRLLIDGVQLCTAFRVGEKNRLLTNNHCLSTSREARNTEVWFGYQCVECGSRAVLRPVKVWGDKVLATHGVLDYTLFTVDRFRAVTGFGNLELDTRPPKAGQEIYIPQHPGGGPAQIAIGSDRDAGGRCVVSNPRAHGYGWYSDASYYCDTQAGSSGSPVLARGSHRVVALHHFGGCPNAGVRMDLIYPQLAPHL